MSDRLAQLEAQVAAMAVRLQRQEDEAAIRRLHHAYGYFMDYCWYDEVIDLFARDGEAVFLSGVYRGHASLRRLYVDFLGTAYTGGARGPVHGFLADHFLLQDVISVAPDGQTATGRFRALLMLGSHESRPGGNGPLPAQVYEAGLYENAYVREGGVWKIARLEYALQWQALYDKGWAHTVTDLPPALPPYPESPIGPDRLLPATRKVWPERSALPLSYAHPVTGRALPVEA
ncbi:nuclear transport factor 2 family protein [Novosphingobium sp. FSY-8]|uniref:Nuclear transport factor 2 family protein n=1 Tax=Novosphingobium ovatum TaxID=1908523 RepID=A0ABW9XAE0_9SPHN|nr:nuclear transport factor 2 family protein [Novosphingobium ovatum]NBC35460.1 nuclear transport factor 2 family protein [Novosphingobium ovatum]